MALTPEPKTVLKRAYTHYPIRVAHLNITDPQSYRAFIDNSIASLANHRSSEHASLENKEYQTALKPPPIDVWLRIAQGFQLNEHQHKNVQAYIHWYSNKQDYLDRLAERARPYLHYIVEAIEERGMPTEIALLPIVESAFQPFAYSPGRAAGIWQFIPSTGKHYGLKQNWWYDGRRDVYRSTQAALDYLEKLNKQFDGDWLLALAAYNTGENNVLRAIKKNKRLGKPTDFWSLSLPRETRGYVPKLLGIANVLAHADSYSVRFKPIPNEPYWDKATIDSQLDLAKAAEFAGISIEEIYRLNPGLNHWATPPGKFDLMLPIDRVEQFKEKFASTPRAERVAWRRHTIKRGETLSQIARRYNTSVATLKDFNQLRNSRIRAGKAIIVPVAAQEIPQYALSELQRKLDLLNQYTPPEKRKITIKVRSGDTLWDISRQYNVRVNQLISWNKLSPKDPLRIGKKIIIWKPRAHKNKKTTSIMATSTRNKQAIQKVIYTVRRGDSLARISKNFKIKITQLKQWNTIGKYIHPGQKLTLYVDITRQAES